MSDDTENFDAPDLKSHVQAEDYAAVPVTGLTLQVVHFGSKQLVPRLYLIH